MRIKLPCPSEKTNIMFAVSFIGAVLGGFCSYCKLDRYYDSPPERFHSGIEEMAHDIGSWLDNWLFGSVFGVFAAVCAAYMLFYILWVIAYRCTKDK